MSPTYKTREEVVQEFLDYAGPPSLATVWNCLEEEIKELHAAASDYHEFTADLPVDTAVERHIKARANLVKEWADVQYVLSQLAIYYNIPGQVAFNRVAENNMTKVTDGEIKRREDGKVLKPDNYKPVDMTGL